MMKRKLILLGIAITTTIVFSACGEKDEMSTEESIVDVVIDNDKNRSELNMYDNDFTVDARLVPDGLDGMVDIKITSNADPVGFTLQANLDDGSYVEGKIKYLYKRFYKSFQVALFTDADREAIKVNGSGDIITINIADGLVVKTIPFNAITCVSHTYWSQMDANNISSTCFIYDYNFDGSQNPSIKVWTSYDDTKVDYNLEWNDPTQYNGLPAFNNYSIGIDFIINSATGNGKVGATANCTVYIEYNNKVYVSTFKESTSNILPVQ